MQDEPDFVLTEAEKDQLKRKRQAITVDSPPATQREEEDLYDDEPEEIDAEGEDEPDEDDDDDEQDNQPDLQAYFDLYDIPDERVISMCRAFASYLVSLRPKTPSKTQGSRAGSEPEPPSQKRPHWLAKRLPWKKPRKNG